VQKTLVATPTYNERDNLPRFIAGVREAAPEADIMVVDDASPDGTGALADEIAARDPHVHVTHRPGKLGLGTAYVDAFRWGFSHGYDWFLEMDADLSHDVRYLPEFFRALEGGADVVIGSRNVPGGGTMNWGIGRKLLSRGGSFYARTILGIHVRDVTAGFICWRRRVLESLDLDRVDSNGYSFQIEMKYRALQQGFKVVETPIVFVDRRVGQSKMSRAIVGEALLKVWALRLRR